MFTVIDKDSDGSLIFKFRTDNLKKARVMLQALSNYAYIQFSKKACKEFGYV